MPVKGASTVYMNFKEHMLVEILALIKQWHNIYICACTENLTS